MKTTSAVLALLLAQNVSAFTPVSTVKTSALFAATMDSTEVKTAPKEAVVDETLVNTEQKFKVVDVDLSTLDPKNRVQTGRYDDREMSVSMPFLKRPTNLDGTHAGDIGFDPLGLSENLDMYTMMEAEVRHARLAMLAVWMAFV